jgi:hypothetical protein
MVDRPELSLPQMMSSRRDTPYHASTDIQRTVIHALPKISAKLLADLVST